MKPLEYRFSLDMSDETTQVFCNVRNGDDCSKLIVSLRENGRAYTFDNDVHVYFLAKKSDEIVVYTECSINNNTIVYNFTAQTAPVSGTVICQFLLLSSSNRLETPTFRLEVFDNINIDPDSPESLPEYTALIDATQDAINATDEMRELMEEIDRDFSSKMDLAPIDPAVEQIAAMLSGQLYGDTVNHKGKVKGGQSFYDTEYIDIALALKAPLSDFNTLSTRAVQPANVVIAHDNWQNYSDANNFTPNRTYGISTRIIGAVPPESERDPTYGYVDNLPVYNKTAALSFIGTNKTAKAGYQIYYNENECWFRKTDSSGSGTWIKLIDESSLNTALALKAPLSDFNTLSARAVQTSNVTITQENWQNYNNANNFTPNRTYGISTRIIGPVPQGEDPDPTYGYVDNLPVYNKTAALTFIGVSKTGKTGYQIYYNENECWFRKTDADGVGTWIKLIDESSLNTALSLKAPLSDFNTLSARAVQPANVIIAHDNWQNYSDANNFTPNRTYGISTRIIGPVPQGEDPNPTYGYVDNLPVYNKTATLTFIGVSKTGKTGYQIYYNDNECWFRKTDSSGSGTWIRIVKAPPTTRGLRTYEVVCFGDSLTAGSGCMIPYHYYESLFGNHICHNYGIGGTGYIKERGSASDPKYDYKGTGQIGKPDSTVELTGGNKVLDHFKENESSITSSSAIVIFAGTNDYGAQYGLDAFETAIRNTYTYVLEHHTQPLIVCTPMNRVARDSETITLEQYVDKIIAVCTEMKIPVIDFYHHVQLRPDRTAWKNVYFADNIHPNDMGHQLIGAFFGAKLNEYLGC